MQPRAGRLDLLLQDLETKHRYEVELQLGATDEGHIIRTVEYWDIERKRYPQYEHSAVLIAEEITGRFLNVVSLTLVFTTVMDEFSRGLVDEDEDAEATPADRDYWEQKGTKATIHLADDLLTIAREFDPSLEPKYNKFYIGTSRDGQPFNFILFRPRKNRVNLEIALPRSDEIDKRLYSNRWGKYRLSLGREDIEKNRDLLKELIGLAYESRA